MADELAAEAPKRTGSPLLMMIVLVLLLTLVGAGAGFAVGALLGAAPPPGQAAAVLPPAAVASKAKATAVQPTAAEKPAATHGTEKPAGEGEQATAPPVETVPPALAEGPLTLVPLPPIITNLAAPEGAWVRVEGALLTRPEPSEKPDILAEKMSGQIVTYLRTVSLTQIEGASGFLAFRDDLDDLMQVSSAGDVQKVLIKSLVVE